MENMWLYEIKGESWGVVIADSIEEAEKKVRGAYKKHDSDYNADTPVIIKNKEDDGNWFPDAPDVIEVYG